jgi:hypothetical protein
MDCSRVRLLPYESDSAPDCPIEDWMLGWSTLINSQPVAARKLFLRLVTAPKEPSACCSLSVRTTAASAEKIVVWKTNVFEEAFIMV